MPKTAQNHKDFESTLFGRLAVSDRFKHYQDAFRTATGLPLRLVSADPEHWCLDDQTINRSPFCELLNLCKSACGACIETNRRLMKEAEVGGPLSCHCFAGLCATAVPVKLGSSVIGFLKTGQVFNKTPSPQDFDALLGALGRKTLGEELTGQLRTAYLQTRTVEPQRYQSMITLLQSFAEQLGQQAESLAIIDEGSEPAAIAKARGKA